MTSPRQIAVVGFEKADAMNLLLERLGLVPDLGAFLSEHLLGVLRQQYSDLEIESIEFIGSGNCTAEGMETSSPNVVFVRTLSLPFNINTVVAARMERYSLDLNVILNATLTGNNYDIKSDVRVQGQTFLGAVGSSCRGLAVARLHLESQKKTKCICYQRPRPTTFAPSGLQEH